MVTATATIGDNSTPQFAMKHILITSGRSSCNKRWILYNIMITSLILILAALHTTNTQVYANKPVRSFIGRRRSRQVVSGSSVESEGGLTLGDLDELMQSNKDGDGPILGPNILFGQSDIQLQHESDIYNHETTHNDANSNSNNNHNQLRKKLGRIHIDLSGRIMCHIISPPPQSSCTTNDNDDISLQQQHYTHNTGGNHFRESVPLFTLPMKKQQQRSSSNVQRRFIPHLFLGANYDLDEVWYGATRWIVKCSWGPFKFALPSSSSSLADADVVGSTSNHHALHSNMMNVYRKFFPTTSLSSSSTSSSSTESTSWIIDVEGEQSVFDHTDTTTRLRLISIQSTSSSSSSSLLMSNSNLVQQTPQQISIEYDSAKYHDNDNDYYGTTKTTTKRRIQYAPTISMNVKTPILHPRLEVHTKQTWIIKEGGDTHGNYYNGDYYGSKSNSVHQRLERIKEGYNEYIPRSWSSSSLNDGNDTTTFTKNDDSTTANNVGFGTKLSKWLENDGWMPRKVTTDLMGNLVSISEIGKFGKNRYNTNGINNDRHTDGTTRSTVTGRMLHRSIIPPMYNAGIRLRVSKRIDWTALGIFPWSSTSSNRRSSSSGIANNQDSANSGIFDALQSTHVKLELCGMYGSDEDRVASVGIDVDPLDWERTFKVIVGQEGVNVLG